MKPTLISSKQSLLLTDRQIEVLRQLVLGNSSREIARNLDISPETVNKHLRSIYSRLQARSRVDAVRWYFEHTRE